MSMDNRFERARLNEWLRTIATTEDDELDCDAFLAAGEKLIAAATRGEDVRAILPDLALHVDHCPDCREWYEAVVSLAETQ
jgi:hypothetical protein